MRKFLSPLLFLLIAPCLAQTPDDQGTDTRASLAAQHNLAQSLRKRAQQGRHEAETTREAEYNACLAKILVNACRQEAREHYIEKMKTVRAMELEANTIDRQAKTKEAMLKDEQKADPEAPKGLQSAPKGEERSLPAPHPMTPTIRRHEADSAPAPSPAKAAEAAAERSQREAQAAASQRERDADAQARAKEAREAAAHYDANAKAIAEKKAKRDARRAAKAAQSGPSSASAPH